MSSVGRLRLGGVSVGLMVIGCNGSWPANMERGPAPLPQEEVRLPPPTAMPVGGVETVDDREDVEDLKNPLASDPKSATRGQSIFAQTCIECHGRDGHGGGPVSQKMPPAPDLRYITVCRRTDGFIYGTLTAGGRAMPSMREGLTSRQRWDLVSFVRQIQKQGCTGSVAAEHEGEE
jgi:mono/diheme cytochrome c family protein